MGLVINTNRLSLDAQAALRTNNRDLEVTAKRLSTGKRVNSAGDDAAGMTISQRITSDVRAYRKTIQNQMDGISLIQVTEGQLQAMQDDLQRVRELMIQAANGTNGADERNALQREINERVKNVEDISNTTRFNSVTMLKGASTDRTNQTDRTIQSGITFSEITNLQFGPAYIDKTVVATPVFISERGINIDANYSYTPLTATQDSAAAEVAAGTASFDYVTKVIGDIRTELTAQGASSVALDTWLATFLDTGTNQANTMDELLLDAYDSNRAVAGSRTVTPPAASLVTNKALDIIKYFLHDGGQLVENSNTPGFTLSRLRVAGATINSYANTSQSHGNLDDITKMIDNISRMRSHLGAIQGSMESKMGSQDTSIVNLEASKSRIIDADMALESSSLVKQQILQRSGVAMLSQANAQPQQLLDLLP
ncbi:MAG: flagellin [Candidatus Melainabacteria bacterium]|nr:flagellin [Candidatus Melainabacteria bacterium]